MSTSIATRNRKVQAQKIVHIIARYAIKMGGQFTGVIVYLVLASKGDTTYTTTLLNGKATGCTCPANKPCYHMEQLEVIEQARMLRKAEEQLAREQAAAVAAAEAMLLSEREDEEEEAYQQWKRDNGLDVPMERYAYANFFDVYGMEL